MKKTFEGSRQKYHQEILYGPIFPCVCCHRLLGRSSVIEVTETTVGTIERKAGEARARGQGLGQQVKCHKKFCTIFCLMVFSVFVSTCWAVSLSS
jgi:hypothetical protein